MQLLNGSIKFEATDVDTDDIRRLVCPGIGGRYHDMWLEQYGGAAAVEKRVLNHATASAEEYTLAWNRALDLFSKKYRTPTARGIAARIIKILWESGRSHNSFNWVRKTRISKDLNAYRHAVGKPKKSQSDNEKLVHHTKLQMVLDDLLKAGIIERDETILKNDNNLDKKKSNVLYRISQNPLSKVLVPPSEERIKILEAAYASYSESYREEISRVEAACDILVDLGVTDPYRAIDEKRRKIHKG